MQRCVRMNVYSVCTGGWAGECGEGTGLRVQVPGAWALNHGPLEGTACVQVCAGVGGGGDARGEGTAAPHRGGWEGTSLITWACVCVSGQGSGCWWLPRTDCPPSQTARFFPQAAPSSAQSVPDLPSPKQKSSLESSGNHPRLTSRAESAAGKVAWTLIFAWVTGGLPCCHSHLQ